MARLVRHDATSPFKIEREGEKPIFICACGLSQNLPYCDGAHKTCKEEPTGILHVYGKDRRSIVDERPEVE